MKTIDFFYSSMELKTLQKINNNPNGEIGDLREATGYASPPINKLLEKGLIQEIKGIETFPVIGIPGVNTVESEITNWKLTFKGQFVLHCYIEEKVIQKIK